MSGALVHSPAQLFMARPSDPVARALYDALVPFALWELPVGCEAAIGQQWLAAWRARAQAAMLKAVEASL